MIRNRKENYMKTVLLLFVLTLIITAIEAVATYVGIKIYGLSEVGKAATYISTFGLEIGILFSFLVSISPAFVALAYCLFRLRFSDLISTKTKMLKTTIDFLFVLAFMTLGATSLMNLPAAINDLLAPFCRGGPLISLLSMLTNFFILFGAFISIFLILLFERKRTASTWKEFKLIVTDPPRYAGHFGLIKNELVPFIDKHSLPFWITNYHNATNDFIIFRAKCEKRQSKLVADFLGNLKKEHLITDFQSSSWNPGDDARNRIDNLRRLGFDPHANMIIGHNGSSIIIFPDSNIGERQEQLSSLFEVLGECTKVVYKHLKTKPKDLWIVSVFVHLLLNSIDYSGPDAPSEEDYIRKIPPL